MRRFIIPIILVSFLIAAAFGSSIWWSENTKPVSDDSSTEDFLIVKGQSASQIGGKLHDEGLIRDPLAFKIYVQITGKADQIQAGEFRLSPSYPLSEIVEVLSEGPIELWVTVPEGLRREQVVERFIIGLELGQEDSRTFRREFLIASEGMEGFLFPDTYLFPRDVEVQVVVDTMRSVFERKTSGLKEEIENSDLSLNEIVTLASIIERETKTDEERPVVAGILLNRLDIGMALQADATVQYAVSSANCGMQSPNADCKWWPTPTRENLKINSPYNTYMNVGLPPGPIANPGLSSLSAVANPSETDYFYYLHDPSEQIHYARTLEEHNENVRRYLRR